MRASSQRQNYEASRIIIKGNLCVYCGDIATTAEHFPPISVTDTGFKLPCCRECNNFASNENPRDFERRVESVKSRIRRRNWKWLQIPDWSHEDLTDLSAAMRREVINGLNKKARTIKRLDFDSLAYIAVIDTSSEFEPYFDRSAAA